MSARRAAGRTLLALLMVSSVVVGTSGTAAADTTLSSDCGVDDAIRGAYSVIDPEIDCGIYNDKYQDLTEQDVYASSRAVSDARDNYYNTRENLRQDLRGLVWMKGKAAAIRAINNGSSEAEAQAAFDAAINNYTSRLIANDMREVSARSAQTTYFAEQIGATNTTDNDLLRGVSAQPAYQTWNLPNGENITISALKNHASSTIYNPYYDIVDPEYGNPDWGSFSAETGDLGYISTTVSGRTTLRSNASDPPGDPPSASMKDPDGQRPNIKIVFGYQPTESAVAYLDIGKQIKDNGDEWVNSTYDRYEAKELESADLWDPITLAQEASTEYNSTGYYSFANAELSALGLTGNTNTSHVVNTTLTTTTLSNGTYENTTYDATIEGTVFLSGSDSLSLTTGETYDPANLSGTPYMTVSSATDANGDPINETGTTIELTNTFTITSATNTNTGESVDVTSAQDKNYTTTNVTEMSRLIEDLIAEREALEEDDDSVAVAPPPNTTQQSGLAALLRGGLQNWFEQLSIGLGIGAAALAAIGVFLLAIIFRGSP